MITFKQFIQEQTSSAEIDALEDKIRTECNLEKFWLYQSSVNPKLIGLQLIVVGKEKQGSGSGSMAMKMLCDFADENALTIVLSPADRNSHTGTTSKARLVQFYQRFGFIKNSGRNKNPMIAATMYRSPKPQ